MITSSTKKSYNNALARTLPHMTHLNDVLPSLDMLPDWPNTPRHTRLFDVTTSRSFMASSPWSSPHQVAIYFADVFLYFFIFLMVDFLNPVSQNLMDGYSPKFHKLVDGRKVVLT